MSGLSITGKAMAMTHTQAKNQHQRSAASAAVMRLLATSLAAP